MEMSGYGDENGGAANAAAGVIPTKIPTKSLPLMIT